MIKKILKNVLLIFVGIFISLNLVKAETIDKKPPEVKSISPISTDFKGGEKVEFEIDAFDDISGIEEILMTFIRKDAPTAEGNEYTFILGLYGDNFVFSNSKTGLNNFENGKKVYAGYVPNDVKEGEYNLFRVYIKDKSGNYDDYCMNDYYGDLYKINDFGFPLINVSEYDGDKDAPVLKKLKFSSNEINVGEEIIVEAEVEDASEIKTVGLYLGSEYYNLVKDEDNIYKTTIKFTYPGKYVFSQITLMDVEFNEQSYIYVSDTHIGNNSLEDGKYDVVVLDEDNDTKLPELKDIKISKSEFKAPSVFEIYIYSEPGLKTSLGFSNKDDKTPTGEGMFKITDEGWNEDHYVYQIEATQYAKEGTYIIGSVYLITPTNETVLYTNTPDIYDGMYSSVKKIEGYSFEIVSDLKANVTTAVNSLSLLDDIKNALDDSIISIDTSKSTIISGEIFESIKGTNKTIVLENNGIQWHFNGNDIKEIKDIDIKTNLYLIKQYNELNDEESEFNNDDKALVIEFANNGVLPGKALVKVKSDYALRNYLGTETLTLYYKNNDKYDVISSGIVESQNEFYEFYIDHNSVYYLTNKNIEKTKLEKDYSEELGNKELVEEIKFQKEKNIKDNVATVEDNVKTEKVNNISLIIFIVSIIIIFIIIAIIILKRYSKNVRQNSKE